MARNRQYYAADLLYVGPTGTNSCTGKHYSLAQYGVGSSDALGISGANLVTELFRVQTANYSFNRGLRDVPQFGELAAIDRISIDQPTVSLDFSYLVANFTNEKNIGFTISSGTQISCISGYLNGTTDGSNYFIRTVGDGNDAVALNETTSSVVGIGNGYLSSYTAEGSVGNFPSATVRVEGLNFEVASANTGIRIPAVNPTDGTSITGYYYSLPVGTQNRAGATINSDDAFLSVLRPGDIVLNLGLGVGQGVISESDMKAQSYNINFDLRRTDLAKLGSKYSYAKVIDFPATATLSVNAVVGDYQSGSLVEIINNNTTFNPSITIYKPGVARTRPNIICEYQLKGAKLRSQEFTSSIGPSKTINLTFESQLSGPQDNTNGVFLSGVN